MTRARIRPAGPDSETPPFDRRRELELCDGGSSLEEEKTASPERELAGLVVLAPVLAGLWLMGLRGYCLFYGGDLNDWPTDALVSAVSFAVAIILTCLVQWGRVLRAAQLAEDGLFVEGWSDDSRLWPHRRKVRFRNVLRGLGHGITRGSAIRRLVGSVLMALAWAAMVVSTAETGAVSLLALNVPALNVLTGIGFAQEAHLDLLDCEGPEAL